jgi:predicted O-methyltransferase YrrM
VREISDFTFPDSELGQLFPDERRAIYESIKTLRPEVCLECGTWSGLGSTYFISHALEENGSGHLHTFDIDSVNKNGKTPEDNLFHYGLTSRVSFHLKDFVKGVEELKLEKINFAFLDGPEESKYTLDCLLIIEDLMPIGSTVFIHDWNANYDVASWGEAGATPKCKATKEYLESEQEKWEFEMAVSDTPSGLARIVKK